MNGFLFEADDLPLDKTKLIQAIIFHAVEFGLVDKSDEGGISEFLHKRISDDQNFVVRRQAWDERATNYERFIYVCALAEVRPTELAPWLKDSPEDGE